MPLCIWFNWWIITVLLPTAVVRVGLWRKLSTKELMLFNCGVGEDSWESLGLQGDPIHTKGNQCWIFIGRTDAEAETPILWPPDVKNWLIWKDPDAGKDWTCDEKGTTEDEMAGWHHQLNGQEFEWTPCVGDGRGGLVCYSPWGHKELDTTEQLNWTEFIRLVSGGILWPPFWCLFQSISLSSFTVTKALSNQAWSLILKLNFLLWRSQIWHHSL